MVQNDLKIPNLTVSAKDFLLIKVTFTVFKMYISFAKDTIQTATEISLVFCELYSLLDMIL